MKKLTVMVILALLVFSVIAFSDDTPTVGYIHDQVGGPFTEMAEDGLALAHTEYGDGFTETEYICDPENPNSYTDQLELAAQENNMVIAIGWTFATVIQEIAPYYPDVKFVCLDFVAEDNGEIISNTHSYTFKEHEGSFLVGVAAGTQSKNGTVGFIGGMAFDVIKKFEYGYRAGVLTADASSVILVEYLDSFSDNILGFYHATKQHELGLADVIFHAAGGSGNGVIESAEILNYWAIGVDIDQSSLAPANVLCSMIKKIDQATYLAVESLIDESFIGGENESLGLADEGVDVSDNVSNLKPKAIKAIEEARQLIIDGTIVVPSNEEEFNEFLIN